MALCDQCQWQPAVRRQHGHSSGHGHRRGGSPPVRGRDAQWPEALCRGCYGGADCHRPGGQPGIEQRGRGRRSGPGRRQPGWPAGLYGEPRPRDHRRHQRG